MQLVLEDVFIIRLHVLKVSSWLLQSFIFMLEKPMGGPFDAPPPPLDFRRLMYHLH